MWLPAMTPVQIVEDYQIDLGDTPKTSVSALVSDTLILVVSDDSELLESIEQYLNEARLGVVTGTNYTEGLAFAQAIRPEQIVLDVRAPESELWGILPALAADGYLKSIPVIGITTIDQQSRCIEQGCVASLTPPIAREALLARINHSRHAARVVGAAPANRA
jgi:CheY-like chemotaxis protein